MFNKRRVEFNCPYCRNRHGSNIYVDEEGEPHIEDPSCKCGAHFLFDYSPAHQMASLGFTESTVRDISPPITLRGQYLIAQKFREVR